MTGTSFSIDVSPTKNEDANANNSFLQTALWGKFKEQHGWKSAAFQVTVENDVRTHREVILVLTKTLRASLVLAYVPHGPSQNFFSSDDEIEPLLSAVSQKLKQFLPAGVVSIRWDLLCGTQFTLVSSEEDEGSDTSTAEPFPRVLQKPLRKPAADVQPPDTVILDLSGSEDQILSRMKKKTRYNVRLAEKKGVQIRIGTVDDVDVWYDLYKETARRDKIAVHSHAYYKDLFELSNSDPHGPQVRLLLAYWDGKLLAGNVVLMHRDQGVYLYGASSNEHRNLMAPYLLQWEGIKLCRAQGCSTYDLFGIPPTNDETHPMHGLYRFKTGFGGRIEHRYGAWDYVFKPMTWFWINQADKLRIWYFKKWKKR